MFIKIKVKAGAKEDKITNKSKNSYLVSTKEKAEKNRANKRVIEIMASFLGVPIKNVRIISGHHSSNKMLSINLPENLL